jgi:hypothetical protein
MWFWDIHSYFSDTFNPYNPSFLFCIRWAPFGSVELYSTLQNLPSQERGTTVNYLFWVEFLSSTFNPLKPKVNALSAFLWGVTFHLADSSTTRETGWSQMCFGYLQLFSDYIQPRHNLSFYLTYIGRPFVTGSFAFPQKDKTVTDVIWALQAIYWWPESPFWRFTIPVVGLS